MKKTVVKIVVVKEKSGVPCWPCIDYDADKEFSRILTPIKLKNPDMDFDLVYYTELQEAKADYENDLTKYDGVLVLDMTCGKMIDIFYVNQSRDGIPTIVADVPYYGSGSVLKDVVPAVREAHLPVPVLSTLDYSEIADAVRLFDVLAKMKQTTILVVANNRSEYCELFEKEWGCSFVFKTSKDINEKMKTVSTKEAETIASQWMNNAIEIREATHEDIIESAALHIVLRDMMKECGANAVTVDCLSLSYGGNYDKNAHMYPCLSHFEMLNNGTIAVCEADIPATVTSLILHYLTDKSGYVSDPVIDTSSNQIIYSHCVGCSKIYGHNDHRYCQYAIRSHAEDKKGASVQVYFPANEQLTTTMIYPSTMPSTIHSSRSVGNVGLQEACRSKLAAEANTKAILNNWSGGWHRVTIFGDYRDQMMNLFKIKGLSVIQEDK